METVNDISKQIETQCSLLRQCALLRRYAAIHGLEFLDKVELVKEWGEEEWEGVQCAAFNSTRGPGTHVAHVTDDGVAKVVVFFFGDDPRWDADKFVELEVSELERAVKEQLCLHAV